MVAVRRGRRGRLVRLTDWPKHLGTQRGTNWQHSTWNEIIEIYFRFTSVDWWLGWLASMSCEKGWSVSTVQSDQQCTRNVFLCEVHST